MSDMKCPLCGSQLNSDILESGEFVDYCDKCKFVASFGLWEKLGTTRKALDVAVAALKSIQEYGAIAMSELQKNGLGGFQKPVSKMQDMAHLAEKRIKEITKRE